jgi:hypothetical protein
MIKLKLGVRSIIGLIILLGLIILVGWQINHRLVAPSAGLSNKQPVVNSQVESDLSLTPTTSPLLSQVQPTIKLPQDSEFMVSGGSPTSTIRFIEGSIKPLDVHVGDTQNFRIVILSTNGIKRVVAEIETDKDINEVELVREGLVGIMDTYPNPYAVNPKDNTLMILDQNQLAQARFIEQQRGVAQQKNNQANAAANQREVWIGSWVVKDTHAETYFTNFIAYDSVDNQEKMTMTWSDLCSIELGGNWTSDDTDNGCTLEANKIDGVDDGDVILVTGKNLNLAAGNITFAWSPEHSIYFYGGQLFFAADHSSQLTKKELYVIDDDNDLYMPGGALNNQTTTMASGYGRRSTMLNTSTTPYYYDCADTGLNADAAFPGSDIYRSDTFTNTVSSTLNYDWNCDGEHEVEQASEVACNSTSTFQGFYLSDCVGYDMSECCEGYVTKAFPTLPLKNINNLIHNLYFNKVAQADIVSCCADSISTIGLCVGSSTITNVDCGQPKNIRWEGSYSDEAGCDTGGLHSYYNYEHVTISCR